MDTRIDGLACLVLLIGGSQFAFISYVFLRCIQCHLVDMTLDTPKMNEIHILFNAWKSF